MSVTGGPYDRGYMPPEVLEGLVNNNERILAILRIRPHTNVELSRICMGFGQRIRALRKMKYNIRSKRIKGGLWLYTLHETPDPLWDVDLETTFLDGHVHVYVNKVNADTYSKARNVAQYGGMKTKIIGGPRLAGTPRPPLVTTEQKLRAEIDALRRCLAKVSKRWKDCRDGK